MISNQIKEAVFQLLMKSVRRNQMWKPFSN